MPLRDLLLLIGGPQGSGMETSGQILTSALARRGYGVLSDREYYSNIVGRHSYVHMRISSYTIPRSLTYPVHMAGFIDAESVFTHTFDIASGGWLIYDAGTDPIKITRVPSMEPQVRDRLLEKYRSHGIGESIKDVVEYLEKEKGVNVVPLSFKLILNTLRQKYNMTLGQAQRFRSTIIFAAMAALLGLDPDSVNYGIERRFRGREKVIEMNKFLASKLIEDIRGDYGTPLALEPSSIEIERLLIATGNDMVGMGKIVGGLRFQSYYPITPAADESTFLESHESLVIDGEKKGNILVFQTEDEIAAIASAIGAGLAGARSATATSGPGFSLMVEALGWAGMNESPVVVTYYQRGGPSTGQPTRGSQSDLLFTMFASHGEFPRIVLASGDPEEAFYDAINAMNYAERYQVPVIHLLDKFLANSTFTVPLPDWGRIRIDRGKTLFEADGDFKRFDKSEPISPRPVIGSGAITWYTGDEHDEYGHITEDPINRLEMYEKRMKKLEIADREIPEEERAKLYGNGKDFLLLGWGFVKGTALDALEALEERGLKGAYLHLRMFIPYPSRMVREILESYGVGRVIAVEHNIMAQASLATTMNTGFKVGKYILKYTGRPIYLMELVDAVQRIVEGGEDKVVLTYGE
ncbi:MAG: 2-oxoacid:acceptor oxidoreductase subunit alpha [Desulfurococcales archaeon]|nr:2-oxoacid:acceptor oxidoreductase subunit alpha [Desulfurococcales archaeon]MCE4605525.1 2-oxoacid:acceptor oxidoreductase subunit alpha [Desulfurococcales archaeon]